MNIVGLLGKVSTDPKIKVVGNSQVVTFQLSVRGAGKWGAEPGSNVGYGSFSIEAWGKIAGTIADHCPKGTVISISGSLKQDTWIDPAGQEKEKVKISLTSFNFVSNQPEEFILGLGSDEDITEGLDHFNYA